MAGPRWGRPAERHDPFKGGSAPRAPVRQANAGECAAPAARTTEARRRERSERDGSEPRSSSPHSTAAARPPGRCRAAPIRFERGPASSCAYKRGGRDADVEVLLEGGRKVARGVECGRSSAASAESACAHARSSARHEGEGGRSSFFAAPQGRGRSPAIHFSGASRRYRRVETL